MGISTAGRKPLWIANKGSNCNLSLGRGVRAGGICRYRQGGPDRMSSIMEWNSSVWWTGCSLWNSNEWKLDNKSIPLAPRLWSPKPNDIAFQPFNNGPVHMSPDGFLKIALNSDHTDGPLSTDWWSLNDPHRRTLWLDGSNWQPQKLILRDWSYCIFVN